MTTEYPYDPHDPHRVAAHFARRAAESLAQAETARPEERTYFRAAAALQALTAYVAEASEDPGLKAALEESVSVGDSAAALRERMPEEYFILPPEDVPEEDRALTLAFDALKTEAARRHVDLSGVVAARFAGL
jgi:hypothetical protein